MNFRHIALLGALALLILFFLGPGTWIYVLGDSPAASSFAGGTQNPTYWLWLAMTTCQLLLWVLVWKISLPDSVLTFGFKRYFSFIMTVMSVLTLLGLVGFTVSLSYGETFLRESPVFWIWAALFATQTLISYACFISALCPELFIVSDAV